VDGGKESTFDITIANRNASALELVDLLVEYPDGTRSAVDTKVALPNERLSLGTIDPGTRTKQTVKAVLFGEAGTTERVTATLEYRVAGSNAIFTKETTLEVMLGASPVAITVEGPDEAVAGQPFDFKVHVRSNAQGTVKNLTVEAQYPFGFSVTNTSPETSNGDALWRLGDLNPGEEKVVTIEGTIQAQDNEDRVFRFLAGSEDDQTAAHIAVPFLSVPHDLTIKRPFVSADLAINGTSGQTVVVSPGQTVRGIIRWKNNLDTEVEDLQIAVKINGQAYDKASVLPSRGFFSSSNATMVWNSGDDPALLRVAPGASGSAEFTFTAKGSADAAVLVNPEISLAVSVGAKRVQPGSVPEQINSAFARTIRIGSALTVDAKSKHFSGPIINSGPMPPRVDQETTYTLVWTIKNPSNTISNTKATTILPAYVRYIGGVSPSTERLSYDARSNTVTWSLGDVKAGVGYGAPAREVSFQVGLTPSISQVNLTPTLMGQLSVTGDDRFTGARLEASDNPPTTRVDVSESQFQTGMETVQK
jgi:hypothetical protein